MIKGRWYPLVLVILVILLDPFTGVSLAMATALAVAWNGEPAVSFLYAFLVGLITDLRQFRWLGSTSLFLMTLVVVVQLVRVQFGKQSSWGVLASGMLGAVIGRIIYGGPLSIWLVLAQGAVTWGFWMFYRWMDLKEGVYLK